MASPDGLFTVVISLKLKPPGCLQVDMRPGHGSTRLDSRHLHTRRPAEKSAAGDAKAGPVAAHENDVTWFIPEVTVWRLLNTHLQN